MGGDGDDGMEWVAVGTTAAAEMKRAATEAMAAKAESVEARVDVAQVAA